jgi:iron(III) transport system substrate-binding protein
MDDARAVGSGQTAFLFFYLHLELGPDFIRALAAQEPTVFREYRQAVDAVGQGRYPLLIGTAESVAGPLIDRGVPIAFLDPSLTREGSHVSPGSGAVALINRAPHPNAARLYLNWLLSPAAQAELARTNNAVSTRLDVPADHTFAWKVPRPDAIKTYTVEAADTTQTKLLPLLYELFGR